MNCNQLGIKFVLLLDRWVQPIQLRSVALSVIALSLIPVVMLPPLAQAQTNPSSPPTAIARPTLRLGNQGAAVTELQALLKLLGFYPGVVDGSFQSSTATAVIAFQQAAGLTADGIVGGNTWNRLLPSAATTTPATTPAAATPPVSTTPTTQATITTPARPTPSPVPRPTTTAPQDTTVAANPGSEVVSLPTLRVGMRGPAVARLQQRLRTLGVFNGEIDGVFGPATQTAVKAAQRRYNLTPDGIVGNATWAVLLR
ncbi:MAG: peptidoglycan-binding protein [Oculatellaceae cyanobacterium bins.114]|nr:peptidoglycan-binding protein [Oculatellaceae cyanobacterium bins.114]